MTSCCQIIVETVVNQSKQCICTIPKHISTLLSCPRLFKAVPIPQKVLTPTTLLNYPQLFSNCLQLSLSVFHLSPTVLTLFPHVDISRYFRDQIITPSTFNMNGLAVERKWNAWNHLEMLIKMTIKDKAEEGKGKREKVRGGRARQTAKWKVWSASCLR